MKGEEGRAWREVPRQKARGRRGTGATASARFLTGRCREEFLNEGNRSFR